MAIKEFIQDIFRHFLKSKTLQEGAALAYYMVFSILPMIMIVISVFGMIWGEKAVSGDVFSEFSKILGNDAASELQSIIKKQHTTHNNTITTIIGFVMLALSSSSMLNQLHSAFNNVWNIAAKPKNSIFAYLLKHFISLAILLVFFFIIMLSITINSFLMKYSHDDSMNFPFGIMWEHIVSYVLIAFMFALMFKFLGDVKVSLKVSMISGLFTAALFILGKYAIGLYIQQSSMSSTFGSASILALLMIWVYYISQILFLGASFLYILGERLGCPVVPTQNATKTKLTEVS